MGDDWLEIADTMCLGFPFACDLIHAFMEGAPEFNDAKRTEADKGHFPHPASWKQLAHYAQSVESGKFRLFCYGKTEN